MHVRVDEPGQDETPPERLNFRFGSDPPFRIFCRTNEHNLAALDGQCGGNGVGRIHRVDLAVCQHKIGRGRSGVPNRGNLAGRKGGRRVYRCTGVVPDGDVVQYRRELRIRQRGVRSTWSPQDMNAPHRCAHVTAEYIGEWRNLAGHSLRVSAVAAHAVEDVVLRWTRLRDDAYECGNYQRYRGCAERA